MDVTNKKVAGKLFYIKYWFQNLTSFYNCPLIINYSKVSLSEKVKSLSVQSRYSYCFSIILEGISHECNLATRLNDLTKRIVQLDSKANEKVVSSLLKWKIVEKIGETIKSVPLTYLRGGQCLLNLIWNKTYSTCQREA